MLKIFEFPEFPFGKIGVYLEILSFLTWISAWKDLLSGHVELLKDWGRGGVCGGGASVI